jgi:hypothetical protein
VVLGYGVALNVWRTGHISCGLILLHNWLIGFLILLMSIDPLLSSFSTLLESFHRDILFLNFGIEVIVNFLFILLRDGLSLEPGHCDNGLFTLRVVF